MTNSRNQDGYPTPAPTPAPTPITAGKTFGLLASGLAGFLTAPAVAPSLMGIRSETHELHELGDRLAWLADLTSGLLVGGTYLLSSAPGGGKSRIGTQIVLELGATGVRSLVILTEEAPQRLSSRAVAMTGCWPRGEAEQAMRHVEWTDEIVDLEQLPAFFTREVLNPRGRFAGVKLIVVDSVQGDGVAANAARKYSRFHKFARAAKAAGITVLAIGHVNKRGQLAGPKGLEHFVDAVWRVEKVADFRIFAVTKNRFGAERPRGIPLLIDPVSTILRPSPHITPVTGSAKTFLNLAAGVMELQASVSLPMPGSRPQITAPGLPRRRIEQLVTAITGVPLLGLEQFDLNIGCLLPGETPFRSWLGLPLSIALIASCIRRPVPMDAVYVGEIDLNRQLRPLPQGVLDALIDAITDGLFHPRTRLFVSPDTARVLPPDMIQLIPCATLDQVVAASWTDLH